MLKLALTPRWLAALLLALAFATGFMMLSQWQLGSATSGQVSADPAKETVVPLDRVAQPLQPVLAEQADSMVRTTGHYVQGSTVLVADRVHEGTHGYWAVSQFVPDAQSSDAGTFSIAVARGFTEDGDPAAVADVPRGTRTVIGRLVANEGPVTTQRSGAAVSSDRILGSAATAELTNRWQTPLYSGIIAADAETPAGAALPLDEQDHVRQDAGLADPQDGLVPIRTVQYTEDSLDWLNVFYAAEWVVFAGFALYLWWRMLGDAHQRILHPERYYEQVPAGALPEDPAAGDGPEAPRDPTQRYFYEEATGRFYYYDPAAGQYFYYDDDPQRSTDTSGDAPTSTR